jgi:WXXGXW repeat (2 copies)
MQIRSACFIAVVLTACAACTVTATAPRVVVHTPDVVVGEVVVARAPPPIRVEEIPAPPAAHPELWVWQPGHWRWEHGDYVWHRGHYERRPAAAAVWVQPEWVERGGQWVFRPGHWVYH